jgi:hypothetical protein
LNLPRSGLVQQQLALVCRDLEVSAATYSSYAADQILSADILAINQKNLDRPGC